jgi:hypothetical protein
MTKTMAKTIPISAIMPDPALRRGNGQTQRMGRKYACSTRGNANRHTTLLPM